MDGRHSTTVRCATLSVIAMLLGACASGPQVGKHAWVGVSEIVRPEDLTRFTLHSARRNVDADRLQAAGLSVADVAAGRLALVFCSPSLEATWFSYAVLPPDVAPQPGDVLRLRVERDTTNDRIALNPVAGGVEPGLRATLPAYEPIPDWRERGLRNNFKKIPLPDDLQDRYRISAGSYQIAC